MKSSMLDNLFMALVMIIGVATWYFIIKFLLWIF